MSQPAEVLDNTRTLVTHEPSQQVATMESTTILAIIERAAKDPTVDIDKMERLMGMHERFQAKQAERAFASAMADMQIELPVIGERGTIKNKNGGAQSTYALWEDVNEGIKPVLTKFGFSLTFRTDTSAGIHVIAVLTHRDGHRETSEILLPADNSGSKNVVQSIASSISYGKRYTAFALLNVTSTGEDDDGNGGPDDQRQPANNRQQSTQDQQSGLPPYSQEKFDEFFPKWKAAIESGKNTPDGFINKIKTTNTLSAEQIQKLRAIKIGTAK